MSDVASGHKKKSCIQEQRRVSLSLVVAVINMHQNPEGMMGTSTVQSGERTSFDRASQRQARRCTVHREKTCGCVRELGAKALLHGGKQPPKSCRSHFHSFK